MPCLMKLPSSLIFAKLILFFSLLTPIPVFAQGVNHTLTWKPSELSITQMAGESRIDLKRCSRPWAPVGAPALPMRHLRVEIPFHATKIKLSVTTQTSAVYLSDPVSPIAPASPPETQAPQVLPDAHIYNADALWPQSWASMTGDFSSNGDRFIYIQINPLRYNPSENTLSLATNLQLTLSWEEPETSSTATKSQASTGNVAYLIITSQDLKPAFQELATHRQARYDTAILTTQEIASAYTGRDLQEKIRQAIARYVQNKGTKYVVLGGDDTVVPDRDTTVSYSIFTETQMPTDLYYAGLSGTWDDDGDNVFGELGEGDLASDVALGRIPVRTPAETSAYITKLKQWENWDYSGLRGKWLLAGKSLWSTYGGSDRPTDALNDAHAAFICNTHPEVSDAEMWSRRAWRDVLAPVASGAQLSYLMDSLSSWDQSGECGSYDFDLANATTTLNQGWEHLFVSTHGKPTHWKLEKNQAYYSSQALSLTAPTAFVYTTACLTNQFDGSLDPSLSESMIRAPQGGALAYIGSSRFGWGSQDSGAADTGSTGGSSYAFARAFYQTFLPAQGEAATIGEAFNRHKLAFVSQANQNSPERWLLFSLNLMGDPALRLLDPGPDTDRDGLPDSIENTGCTNVNLADTDGDGLTDGQEDANANGIVDASETNPCLADTDQDGIIDRLDSSPRDPNLPTGGGTTPNTGGGGSGGGGCFIQSLSL